VEQKERESSWGGKGGCWKISVSHGHEGPIVGNLSQEVDDMRRLPQAQEKEEDREGGAWNPKRVIPERNERGVGGGKKNDFARVV